MNGYKQKVGYLIRIIFQPRDQEVSYPINPPLLFPIIFLASIGFVMYTFGNPKNEIQYRLVSLLLLLAASTGRLLSRKSETMARWGIVLVLSAIIVFTAWWLRQPTMLSLLILPTLMAAMLINLPALGIMLLIHTAIILYAGDTFPSSVFNSTHEWVALGVLWLPGLFLGGGYFQIEKTIHVSEENYRRLQDLLADSRQQQLKLAQTLDNLEDANRQLSLLYEKNISFRKAAEEARESKMLFIAKVSHEIRAPLSIILGVTGCIIEDQEIYGEALPLDLIDDIRVIRRSSEHLLSLVNDVLDLTRAEAGQLILKKEWTDLPSEIKKCLEILQPLASKKQLSLVIDLPTTLPSIYCDQTRIRQVILNLLSNAIRYTEQGQVGVQAFADDHWLTVQIWDTGPGINPEDVEKIFEPFYRGSGDSSQETYGSGIGLSVSRQLLDLHKGKIWLENRPGSGSSFFFKLPISLSEIPTPSVTSYINENWVWLEKPIHRTSSIPAPRKRILICDPEDSLITQAQRSGINLDLEKAISLPDLFQRIQNVPAHLVLINSSTIPELMEAVQIVSDKIQDTPIIGCSLPSSRERLQRLGARQYIQKPFNAAELLQAVELASSSARKILIVDDNIEMQHLIARILSNQGNTVEFLLASTGQEAWEIILHKKPDLILLDLALPEMSGWALLEKKKNAPTNICQIPVIIVSAHDLEDTPPISKTLVISKGEGILPDSILRYALNSLNLT